MDTNAMVLPKLSDGRSAKEKLKDWYIDKIANNGKSIERVDDILTNVTAAAGGVALACFAPQLIPSIPAIQAGYKFLRKFVYNASKKAIHKKLDIKEDDLNVKDTASILEAIPDKKLSGLTEEVTNNIINGGVPR